jgi:hypothetical protein
MRPEIPPWLVADTQWLSPPPMAPAKNLGESGDEAIDYHGSIFLDALPAGAIVRPFRRGWSRRRNAENSNAR